MSPSNYIAGFEFDESHNEPRSSGDRNNRHSCTVIGRPNHILGTKRVEHFAWPHLVTYLVKIETRRAAIVAHSNDAEMQP
jgi:hypothetical protein